MAVIWRVSRPDVEAGDFDRPYIVMELVHGRSLMTRLDETPLPPAEVAGLGAATVVRGEPRT